MLLRRSFLSSLLAAPMALATRLGFSNTVHGTPKLWTQPVMGGKFQVTEATGLEKVTESYNRAMSVLSEVVLNGCVSPVVRDVYFDLAFSEETPLPPPQIPLGHVSESLGWNKAIEGYRDITPDHKKGIIEERQRIARIVRQYFNSSGACYPKLYHRILFGSAPEPAEHYEKLHNKESV